MELIETYLIVGIKHQRETITDIRKQPSYDHNIITDSLSVIREYKNDLFVDFGEYGTRESAIKRLENIFYNIPDVKYWSILPIMVYVTTVESRKIKLKKLYKKIK